MSNSDPPATALLPPDALSGVRIAISVSESPDLFRLGLMEAHFRLALGEIARSVLVGNGKLAYGGHLKPDGYTIFLTQELHRYSRRDRPLRICLAWPQHRELSLQELDTHKTELGLFGDLVCLSPDGKEVDFTAGRGDEPERVRDEALRKQSLTSMRRYIARITAGRVLIGGKRDGFQGNLPGLLEESLITLQHRQPLYLAAGFGGVTYDIARNLAIDDGNWFPSLPNAPQYDQRLTAGLAQLSEIAASRDWMGLQNGLSVEENLRLAATHRPSEIAALVSLGLGRRFSKETLQ